MTHASATTSQLDASTAPILSIRNLHKSYGAVTALDGVDLDLSGGHIVGLLGENGCGKSTLMKTVAGLVADYTGDIRVLGHEPGPATKAVTAFLPDSEFLPRGLSLSYCLELYDDFFADFDRARAEDLLGFFRLDTTLRLKQMSKGMREKAQIALTMARRARLFLLDEPISGVDPSARQGILDGIMRHLDDDSVVLISTHLIHDLEPALDSVVMMRHGRVILTGDADDLRTQHRSSLDQLFREMYR